MSDPVTPRILSGGSFTDYSGLTVAACIAKAGTAVKYAAVEYWGECYWGNTLASTQSGTCDTPCAGDNNQNCGGSGSAQVYENTAYVAPKPTTTSTTASKTTSTAISITTTSAVSSPTLVPSTGNFKSVGCYTDSAAPRLLSVGSFVDNSGMTVAACAAKAGSSKYFAVEYAVECYWGNELSSAQTSENCNMACAGAATQLCGGGNAATVYQNSNFDEPPTSVPTVLPSSGNWQSSGCYVDSSNPRLLQKGSSTDGALTVAKCIAKAGYVRYIAVEYGSECYWGSVLSSGQKSSACTVACSGESSQLCGGAYAANVYENTEWRPPLSKQEIIDAIREISDYLSTLYESLAALKNAAQAPTRRSIIRKRQEDLEALLTGVQNRARTLSSLFKRRVPQVQEAFELQVIDSSISDPFIAQQAAFESVFAEIMSIAPVALPIAEALALATATYTAVNVARDIFDSLLKLLTPSDNPPTVTDHPTQETPNPEPTKTSTATSSSTTSSANACDIFAAVATAPPMVPLKRSLPEDELPDQELSHSALKKRYSTGKLGNYGIAYGKFQPPVDFCQQNNDFHFFAPKYPSTSRLSTGTAQPDNGNEKADDLEQDDRNSADTSRSAPDILGIGKIDLGGPYIDMQWDYNVPDWPSDEQITLCRPYIKSFPDRMSCTNDVYYYTSRGNPARGVEHQYDTEHVFEKHIVKDFFYFVFERGWYDCAGLNRIFGTANNGENAAKQMMAQMAWYDPIHPDYPDSRLGELFVLERGLNLFKGAIMNGRPLTESERQHNVLPRPQTGYAETIQSLESAKLVMEYLSKEPVSL
ncbi:hypothetical protein DL95DRAFT_116127 [Leptodontidium sp. 2 PMI_412]|nr:hypothetical protein DL95DRAFT_116127 [Leptodontidium sp. 2 PMI_412]